ARGRPRQRLGRVPAGRRGPQPVRFGAGDEAVRDVHSRRVGRPDRSGQEEHVMTKQRGRVRRLNALTHASPLAAVVGGVGSQAASAKPSGQERPVVDTTFLYNELYHLGTSYIFRSAGADGPLSDPSDPNNLPANYNGSQEFYKWFAAELTNSDAS